VVTTSRQGSKVVDRLGTFASTACAVHCLASALLPSAIAALGLGALFGHEAEWGFTLGAVALAVAALGLGWPKHRSPGIATLLLIGVMGLLGARLVEEAGVHGAGTALGVVAGLALVAGHVWGIRITRRSTEPACAHPGDQSRLSAKATSA